MLETGEQGYETDTGRRKIGDGATAWTSLAYIPVVPSATTVAGNYTVASSIDTVNVNTASATITLPAATVVGRRITVRKVSASAGTVTINRAGTDDITRAPLTSVTLTSNGDFWTLECVAAGRWDLVDGFETITGTNDGIKSHDGTMEQWGGTSSASDAVGVTFVSPFSAAPVVVGVAADTASGGTGGSYVAEIDNVLTTSFVIKLLLHTATTVIPIGGAVARAWHAIGRWYA